MTDFATPNRTLPGPPDAAIPPSRYPFGSSEWYIDRMSRALIARRDRFDLLTSYYRGTQKLAVLAGEAWAESGLATMFPDYLSANYSRLIVNAAAQRLVLLGFRLGGDIRADTEAARIWRANDMESMFDVAITESLVKGECPILVEPDPRDPRTPVITPQDPSSAIVWTADGDRRIRLVAMKTWWDETVRKRYYTLYFPDRIERWQDHYQGQMDVWRNRLLGTTPAQYEQRDSRQEPWRVANPLGEVPMVALYNEPLLKGMPEGEHESALGPIDHYNSVLMDMAVTSKELAFPGRYGTGVEDGDDDTEETDVPRPATAGRIKTGQTRWITTPTPDATFGQFTAASIENYVKQLQEIRAAIATITFTPYYTLMNMPSSVAPSGDAITALDSPPADKARGHQRDKGSATRTVMRLAFGLAGDEDRANRMRFGVTVWAPPDQHSEAAHIDALGKMRTMLGVPEEATWELLPAPPEEIARWRQMRDEAAAEVSAQPTPPDPGDESSAAGDAGAADEQPNV